ncbi:hypothetical protein GOODEAATRI_013518, partial [Goodea atripinnis]
AMLNASFENFKCLSDGKDDNGWATPPEPLTQAVGDKFSVVVTHFLSPSDLVVQKVENAGVQPIGESWSKDCILALQRQLSSRVLQLEIQGAQEGKTLVSMIDEASDPQTDFAELLISAGYAAPASTTVNLSAEETTATAAASGG